jgi:hypothetical protein
VVQPTTSGQRAGACGTAAELSGRRSLGTHSTVLLDRTITAAGRACTCQYLRRCHRRSHMLITPKAIVFTAPGFRVARLFMLGTDAQEGGGAKIRHPPFRLGYLQETHKWALVSFLRIGTLGRHLAAWAPKKHAFGASFWRASTQFH